jgi:hypothetical protein
MQDENGSVMNKSPSRYDVTVTVAKDNSAFPDPADACRGSRAGRIEQGRQRNERAHGRADHRHPMMMP